MFSLSGVQLASLELAGGVRCTLLSPDGTLLIAGWVRCSRFTPRTPWPICSRRLKLVYRPAALSKPMSGSAS